MVTTTKDMTSVVIGKHLLARARIHKFNISEVCRDAIERECEIREHAMLNSL